LTGCPSELFYHDELKDIDGFWQRILISDKKKFPMCACTSSDNDTHVTRRQVETKGLQDGHAYTVIGAKEITLAKDLSKVRLVKVRNPWGKNEWKGDWSDRSKKWTTATSA